MKAIDVNEELIGKRCKCVFSGLVVTGVIEDIKIDEHTAEVLVCYDKPHQWGTASIKQGGHLHGYTMILAHSVTLK